jgi:SAM-dependent methyltransferase
MKWFEDEELWMSERDIIFNRSRVQFTFREVAKLVQLLQMPDKGALLDLACGIGRHALEFAKQGFDVTGVDITKPYLEIARESAKQSGLSIAYEHGDMREYCRPDYFDVIVSMCTSFGFFEDIQDDRDVLRNCYRSLRKGGKMVIDVLGKEIVAAQFKEKQWVTYDDHELLAEARITGDWSWIECKWIILKGDYKKELRYSHRLYSAFELKAAMVDAGFTDVTASGDLSGRSLYDNNAKSLVVVGTK